MRTAPGPDRLGAARRALRGVRWRAWLRWGSVALLAGVLVLDLAFPPRLPGDDDTSTLVVSADGTPLRAFADRQGIWRYPTRVDAISPLYLQALLGYEDRWFWKHPGINPVALLRAGGQWLRGGRIVSGGSTLTMQVVRILDADADATVLRDAGARPATRTPRRTRSAFGKVRQLLRALQLEAHLSKAQILALYLQRAPYGGTLQGVEAASWAYLGKPARRLSHAEAALLAVLPQAPSRLRPDRHPQAAQRARDKVLARMATLGIWSTAQVDDARVETVVARTLRAPLSAALLAQRLHAARPTAARIDTGIDAALQRTLEDRVAAYFSRLPPRTSAALLVVDNQTLLARAYVGSLQFADKARLGHVDMVQAWRSPGSTLKPFLYGLALDDGLIHSESLLVDAPQAFGDYRPGNFDAAFNGPVGAAEALRLSLNVPAVDLLDRIGPARFAARLDNAGISLKLPAGATPNLSIILGGIGARLEDLVGAYAAFNRGGIAGRVRYTPADAMVERRLLSPGAAWIVRGILQANPRPGEVEGFDVQGRPRVAWKTGTSYGFRDAWALGATSQYTVGVWVGRPDGTPLPGQYGAVTALPLLFEVVDSLPRAPAGNLASAPPAGVVQADICWPLGTAADTQPTGLCQRRMPAWLLDGAAPPTFAERGARVWSAGRVAFDIDVATGARVSLVCSHLHTTRRVEIARWPALATPWLPVALRKSSTLPPLAADCMADGRDAAAELQISGIHHGATLVRPPGSKRPLHLSLRALGTTSRVQWLLDGHWIAESTGSGSVGHDFNDSGRHTLTALADSGAWTQLDFQLLDAP